MFDRVQAVNTNIEAMAENGKLNEAFLPGASSQLSLLAGGEEPTSATMKMRGGSIPVEGEFAKGDRMKLYVEAHIFAVEFVDKLDKEGYPIGTERRHIARISAIERA